MVPIKVGHFWGAKRSRLAFYSKEAGESGVRVRNGFSCLRRRCEHSVS